MLHMTVDDWMPEGPVQQRISWQVQNSTAHHVNPFWHLINWEHWEANMLQGKITKGYCFWSFTKKKWNQNFHIGRVDYIKWNLRMFPDWQESSLCSFAVGGTEAGVAANGASSRMGIPPCFPNTNLVAGTPAVIPKGKSIFSFFFFFWKALLQVCTGSL